MTVTKLGRIIINQKISPVAWQYIHFHGHYTFRDNKHLINLEEMLARVPACNPILAEAQVPLADEIKSRGQLDGCEESFLLNDPVGVSTQLRGVGGRIVAEVWVLIASYISKLHQLAGDRFWEADVTLSSEICSSLQI